MRISTTIGSSDEGSDEGDEDYPFKFPVGKAILDQAPSLLVMPQISRAADWVEEELKISSKDSLWYERLGYTYLDNYCFNGAISAFKKAKELPDRHLGCLRGLAVAYGKMRDLELAIETIGFVIAELRAQCKNEGASADDKDDLAEALRLQAGWYLDTTPPNLDIAVSLYREVVAIDPNDHDSKWKLFKALADSDHPTDAFELLQASSIQPADKAGDLDPLSEMLLNLNIEGLGDVVHIETFDLLVSLTASGPLSKLIMEGLERCVDLVYNRDNGADLVRLLLFQGVAMFRYNLGKPEQKGAAALWRKCCSMGLKEMASTGEGFNALSIAIARLCVYYDALARRGGQDAQELLFELQQFYSEAQKDWWLARVVRCTIAAYYLTSGSTEKARDILRSEMADGLSMLSDDDPENDHLGYRGIGIAAIHAGDDLNALSAWSLLLPNDVDEDDEDGEEEEAEDEDKDGGESADGEDEEGLEHPEAEVTDDSSSTSSNSSPVSTAKSPPTNDVTVEEPELKLTVTPYEDRKVNPVVRCDGGCGMVWTYADDFYICKTCADIEFDFKCLEKLRAGTLKRVACSRDHDFLHLPPFSKEEYQKVGKGNVRVGGTLVDGTRQGGEIIPIADWLQSLRDEWDIPKETSVTG